MSTSIERYIEMEARERNMLRYESMLWGVLSAGAAIGAGVLLMSGGHVLMPILLGVVALAAYIKRDEVVEEYHLKSASGAGRVTAKQWAKELGHTKLVDGKVAEKAAQKAKPAAVTADQQFQNTERQDIKDQLLTDQQQKPQKNWEQTIQHEAVQKSDPAAALRQ